MERVYRTITKTIKINAFSEKINLWCFGDIHRFTKSCDEERWKHFLSEAKKDHNENTYYLGLGDYTDFASSSEQKALKSEMHEQTIDDFGEIVQKRNRVLSTEMSFMKGNVLGLVDGNHGWVFHDGTTGTEDLANRLNTEYLGWLCHYTLKISVPTKSKPRIQSIYIVACHGKAGGKTAGNSINQVDDLKHIFPIADLYIMGHDHQRLARPVSVLVPSYDGKGDTFIRQKRQFLCSSGSFKKAYVPDSAGYEVGRLLRPADLGALKLEISFHRDMSEGDRVITDIKAII